MKRLVPTRTTLAVTAIALVTAALACERAPVDTDNPDDLEALLADDELDVDQLPRRSALSESGDDPGTPPVPPAPPMPPPRPPTPPVADAGVRPDPAPRDGGSAPDALPSTDVGGVVDAFPGRDARDAGFPLPCPRFPPGVPLPPGFEGCMTPALGDWQMDDCRAERTELRDSSSNNFVAFRSVGAKCVDGAEGRGVSLPGKTDIIHVPDQPAFTFKQGVTVAAWVKATRQGGQQTIFRKREGKTSNVALMQVGRWLVFVIDRQDDVPAAATAVLPAGDFHHVAGTYDNKVLRLYIDGKEVATATAPGVILDGEGPLLFGNDGSRRRFEGTLDKVLFDVKAASAETITSLQCLHRPAKLSLTPSRSDAVQPGTPVSFQLGITNADTPSCGASSYSVFNRDFFEFLRVDPSFQSFFLAPGESASAPFTVTSSFDVESGDFPFTLTVSSFSGRSSTQTAVTGTLVVNATGCRVSTRKSIIVTDLSVVDDPVRTRFTAAADDPRRGVWTLKHLMEQIAGTPEAAARMTEDIFTTFTEPQMINGFRVEARFGVRPFVLDPWPRKDGLLDLEQAPLQLLAIVNRLDLRSLSKGNAGEGRFVFGIVSRDGFPFEATVIFEYALPAASEADILAWARDWHALGSLPFPSEEYNDALSRLTARFAGRGVMPGRPAGSSLNAFRTNEISFGGIWELREFTLDKEGVIRPDTIKLTPDSRFDNSERLARLVNDNEEAVLAEQHDIPASIEGEPFLGGSVFNNLSTWRAAGVRNPEARHKFALNTCNGCHSSDETGTGFLMVSPRFGNQPARLSPFMTGIILPDPVTGVFRALNDLGRRNRDMVELVCPPDEIPPLPPPPVLPPPITFPPFGDGGVVDGGPIPPPFSDGGVGGAGGSMGGRGGSAGTGGMGPVGGPVGGGGAVPPKPPAAMASPGTMVPPTRPAAPTSVAEGIRRVH